jgi:CheY-like chemotaxis protein
MYRASGESEVTIEAGSGARRPRIVVGDDYPSVLAAFVRMLGSSCDIVATVTNGDEAVAAVSRLRPDILVVDLMMPDMNGLDVCRTVKQTAPETAVVIVTAFDDPDVRAIALRDGASAVMPKYSVDLLPETLRRIFAEAPSPKAR